MQRAFFRLKATRPRWLGQQLRRILAPGGFGPIPAQAIKAFRYGFISAAFGSGGSRTRAYHVRVFTESNRISGHAYDARRAVHLLTLPLRKGGS